MAKKKKAGDKCTVCNAYCCRHVAMHIDNPKSAHDFDIIRWYLLHKNVWVSIDHQDNWILEFKTACRKITKDQLCGDYENRPDICREYPEKGEYCEREIDMPSYKYLFKNSREFARYVKDKKLNIQ